MTESTDDGQVRFLRVHEGCQVEQWFAIESEVVMDELWSPAGKGDCGDGGEGEAALA